LDILAVLSDEGRGELDKCASKLRNDLGPDKVLDRLLLLGLGEDVDFELCVRDIFSLPL
jgi:hypothetical protein